MAHMKDVLHQFSVNTDFFYERHVTISTICYFIPVNQSNNSIRGWSIVLSPSSTMQYSYMDVLCWILENPITCVTEYISIWINRTQQ